jgi:bifunctional non-homologous end joining protein LigD
MGLREYRRKRSFGETPEPTGSRRKAPGRTAPVFVVQKHRASHLHYDFRLEEDGVLKSWAVPKGPSLDPRDRRLAMAVEDHPLDYADFEGVIPEGQYGGGTVMVWDSGTWEADGDVTAGLREGELRFTLHGRKLRGAWTLVRTHDRSWLLIKRRDRWAAAGDVAEKRPRSILTRRTLAQIASDEGGDVAKAATGDPARRSGRRRKPSPAARA